jgi:hypothetical protein
MFRRSIRLTVHATSELDNNVWPVVIVAELLRWKVESGTDLNVTVYQPKHVVTVRGAGSLVHDGAHAAP